MPYFSVAEARAYKPLDKSALYSDADITAMCTTVETALEAACDRAWQSRSRTDVVSGDGSTLIRLPHRQVTAITSISVDETALTSAELDEVEITGSRFLYWESGWEKGVNNISVNYTYGETAPPADVKRAAILLCRQWLVDRNSPTSSRQMSVSHEDGTSERLLVAGMRGNRFDVPEANAVVAEYGYTTPV